MTTVVVVGRRVGRGRSVGWSVGRSFGRSVGHSVAFVFRLSFARKRTRILFSKFFATSVDVPIVDREASRVVYSRSRGLHYGRSRRPSRALDAACGRRATREPSSFVVDARWPARGRTRVMTTTEGRRTTTERTTETGARGAIDRR